MFEFGLNELAVATRLTVEISRLVRSQYPSGSLDAVWFHRR
jgi:hypothetical protein